MASEIQSPPPFALSSNNDQLERDQVRAARAAFFRRKTATVSGFASPADDPRLSDEQVAELFQRCIKLASENKINQKNSWELKLIDHLSDIIKAEGRNDSQTNFQKASCTLEARVKIYSVRVDSVHAEAYKVLGRINRAGLEDEPETSMEAGYVSGGKKDKSRCRKELERKVSPKSTLGSSFEALNVKKFDVAFTVDPLYHQTSSQFDEGGVKGRADIGKCRSSPLKSNSLNMIDLSFVKESAEQMAMNMVELNEISPTLNEILCYFDKDNRRSAQFTKLSEKTGMATDAFNDKEVELDFSPGINDTTITDDDINVNREDINFGPSNQRHQEDNNWHTSIGADNGDRFEEVSAFLFQGLSSTSKTNAWAGSEHWKYWRPKGSEDAPANVCRRTSKKAYKNHTEVDLVFTTSIGKEFPDICSPQKSLKSLLLPENRVPRHRLPEDFHYPPDDLIKLFVNFLVTRHEVQYDRISKRIDLHALKKALWDQMQEFVTGPDSGLKDIISFKYILSSFPVNCQAAKPAILEDISPYLCFICLLHLANEHGLTIHDFPSLDDLYIHLPF